LSRSVIGFAGPPGDEAKQIPDSAFVSGGGFGQDWMRKIPGSGRVLPSKWARRRGVASRLGSRRDRLGVCQGLLGVAVDKGAYDLEVLILLLELDQVSAVLEHNELRAGHGVGDVLR